MYEINKQTNIEKEKEYKKTKREYKQINYETQVNVAKTAKKTEKKDQQKNKKDFDHMTLIVLLRWLLGEIF